MVPTPNDQIAKGRPMTTTADLLAAAEQTGLRLTSQSQKRLAPKTRRLHQVILQAFLDSGTAPTRPWLDGQAASQGLDPETAMAELADADLVHLADASVIVAYPFSGVPTDDRVQLEGRPSLFAMCAIDALGVLLMAGQNGVIYSTDPHSGEPIRVERQETTWTWAPSSTVVLAGLRQSCATAAEGCCPHVAFYTDSEGADAHLNAHPELTGGVLGQADALALADLAFGSLLSESRNPS